MYSYYDREFNEFYIWGEVINGTEEYQHISALVPEVYDADGSLLTTEDNVEVPLGYDQWREVISLAPDQHLSFSFVVYLPEGASFEEDFKIVVKAEPAEAARDDLDIPLDDFDLADWPSYLFVSGTYKNPGADLTEYVVLVVSVYDEAEQVIGVGGFYTTDVSYLTSGDHEFEVEVDLWEIVGYLELQIYSYKVQIFGF